MGGACTRLLQCHFILYRRASFPQLLLLSDALVNFFHYLSWYRACRLVRTSTSEVKPLPTAIKFSGNRTGSFPGSRSISHWAFPTWSCQCPPNLRNCEKLSCQPGGIEHSIREPSFRHWVLGSLPSMKVKEVREIRPCFLILHTPKGEFLGLVLDAIFAHFPFLL